MKAAEFFAEPNRHCKFAAAKTDDGAVCSFDHERMQQMCLVAALYKFYPPFAYSQLRLVEEHLGVKDIYDVVSWNNAPERIQEDVYNLCLELQI